MSSSLPARRAGRLPVSAGRRAAATAALGIFALVVSFSYLGLLAGADVAVAGAKDRSVGRLIDSFFPLVALLWSPELSVLLGMAAAALLWRAGFGARSVAPLGFLLLIPVEVAVKATLHRPPMPPFMKPWASYPLVNPQFQESVLSGSAIRTGFLCLLLAAALWDRGGRVARLGAFLAVAVAVGSAFVRVYGRYHWLSDELAGELLGAALAMVVAQALGPSYSRGGRTGFAREAGDAGVAAAGGMEPSGDRRRDNVAS